LTWVLEQKNRFDLTLSSFDAAQPETIGELIDRYNEEIEVCVLTSNFGFAAEIDQAESPLERHEHEEQTKTYPGVMDLKRLEGGQKNFINQLLAYIH
jgi:short-subunit dehydrogenase